VAIVGLSWEIVARVIASTGGPTAFFPSPSKVFATGYSMVVSWEFWQSFLVSNLRVLAGFTFWVFSWDPFRGLAAW
jgi:ABC-type nitrate/sulfonate/bicarbonate transport system permease component